jgi:Secretion system C-terminal sorting domain
MKKPLLLILFALTSLVAFAQHKHSMGTCGMSTAEGEQLVTRMLLNRVNAMQIPITERGAVSYIPIHFHLTANSLGTGRHKEWNVLDQLCDLNDAYRPYEIQFYLSEHPVQGLFDKSISSDNVYNNQSNTFAMAARRHPNALNVYVALNAATSNNQPGVTLAYYTPTNDWIVSKKDQINGSGNGTLAHEVGHFFSLPHTFLGWENGGFDATFPTWPKAPATSPGGTTTERQNGTNCTTAGDKICDTPPDYNFGFGWPGCTPYTGGAQDPLGTVVDPQENNFMGYFIGCSNYVFTPGQITNFKNDLAASDRNYLDNTFAPASTTLTIPANFMLSPAQNEVMGTPSAVPVTWASVPEATHYLVEVDLAPSFISTKLQSIIVKNTTSATFALDPSKTYYYRVRPFNLYTTCGAFTNRSFKTGTSVGIEDLPNLVSAEVAPNPISGSEFNLMLNATESFDMNARLTDATGRVVLQKQNVQVIAGEQAIAFDVADLPNGAYFLSITAGNRTETKLVSIVR